jgi:hypothetical protein
MGLRSANHRKLTSPVLTKDLILIFESSCDRGLLILMYLIKISDRANLNTKGARVAC